MRENWQGRQFCGFLVTACWSAGLALAEDLVLHWMHAYCRQVAMPWDVPLPPLQVPFKSPKKPTS